MVEASWQAEIVIAILTLKSCQTLSADSGAKQRNLNKAYELLLMVQTKPASVQETKSRAEQLSMELEIWMTSQEVASIHACNSGNDFDAVMQRIVNPV